MRTSVYLLATLWMLVCGTSMLQAQNRKWGKPSAEEWALTVCDSMPEADAVVLNKTVSVEYQLTGEFRQFSNVNSELTMDNYHTVGVNQAVDEGGTTMKYDVRLRLKVLKESGTRCGRMDIVYFDSDKDMYQHDEFYSFGVTRFEQVNGKVKKQKLSAEQACSDERLDTNFKVRHIDVKGLKVGDIVEVQYTLFSRRVGYLYDWPIQEVDVPVMYAQSHMEIPCFLQFNMQVPVHPLVTSRVEEGVLRLPQQTGDMQAPKTCKTNCYTIEAHDVMPLSHSAQGDGTPAGISSRLIELRSALKGSRTPRYAPLPAGKRHLMIGVD